MPALNVITEYIIGYLYPGYPAANILFKVYGHISMKQGITFLEDFKLGHYMKVAPRAMFMAQVSLPNIYIKFLVHRLMDNIWSNLLWNNFLSDSWYYHSSTCAFRNGMVAYEHNPQHMRQGVTTSR